MAALLIAFQSKPVTHTSPAEGSKPSAEKTESLLDASPSDGPAGEGPLKPIWDFFGPPSPARPSTGNDTLPRCRPRSVSSSRSRDQRICFTHGQHAAIVIWTLTLSASSLPPYPIRPTPGFPPNSTRRWKPCSGRWRWTIMSLIGPGSPGGDRARPASSLPHGSTNRTPV